MNASKKSRHHNSIGAYLQCRDFQKIIIILIKKKKLKYKIIKEKMNTSQRNFSNPENCKTSEIYLRIILHLNNES